MTQSRNLAKRNVHAADSGNCQTTMRCWKWEKLINRKELLRMRKPFYLEKIPHCLLKSSVILLNSDTAHFRRSSISSSLSLSFLIDRSLNWLCISFRLLISSLCCAKISCCWLNNVWSLSISAVHCCFAIGGYNDKREPRTTNQSIIQSK